MPGRRYSLGLPLPTVIAIATDPTCIAIVALVHLSCWCHCRLGILHWCYEFTVSVSTVVIVNSVNF